MGIPSIECVVGTPPVSAQRRTAPERIRVKNPTNSLLDKRFIFME
jgi:hypothetical protein